MFISKTAKMLLRAALLAAESAACVLLSCDTARPSARPDIPAWVNLHSLHADWQMQTDQGTESCRCDLRNGRFQLTGNGFAYTAPEEWLVADAIVFDVDRDGADEVLLHVWKPGSFGQYQPFWREPDDKSVYSEHLFLFEWDPDNTERLSPKWMSSAMPISALSLEIAEHSVIVIRSPENKITRWQWQSWGLILLE